MEKLKQIRWLVVLSLVFLGLCLGLAGVSAIFSIAFGFAAVTCANLSLRE